MNFSVGIGLDFAVTAVILASEFSVSRASFPQKNRQIRPIQKRPKAPKQQDDDLAAGSCAKDYVWSALTYGPQEIGVEILNL